MGQRREYVLQLSGFQPGVPLSDMAALPTRELQPPDAGGLADLMIEAYRGTIDYDGETVDEAAQEIEAFLAGERGGPPIHNASRLAFAGPQLVGACLAVDWSERHSPLIAYVMTRAGWKGRGVGKRLLDASLQQLQALGYREARAVITVGNTPSERLFAGCGFLPVDG